MQQIARVVTFVDYQNSHFGALRAFWSRSTSPALGHINPRALGELLVARRTAYGLPCQLAEVRVYRGSPEPRRQPKAAAANDRQAEAWTWLGKTRVIRRPLRYPRKWPVEPAQEKGIDVAIAVDMVRLAIERAYDVGVLVSADTDLLPALEAVVELGAAHVEVAAWKRQARLRFADGQRRLWCHHLLEDDYRAVLDSVDYTRSRVPSGRMGGHVAKGDPGGARSG